MKIILYNRLNEMQSVNFILLNLISFGRINKQTNHLAMKTLM